MNRSRIMQLVLALALCLPSMGRLTAARAGTFTPHEILVGRRPPEESAQEGRVPVIFLHGWGFGSPLTWLRMRVEVEELSKDMYGPGAGLEVLYYDYDDARPYDQIAEEFVADVEARFGPTGKPWARRPILVAVSAGGLLARYAMELPGFGERVRGLVTIASPLHGALGASMLFAGPAFREELGEEIWRTVEDTREDMDFERYGPVLQTLGFDNLGPPDADGNPSDLIPSADLERWGVPVNQRLREINLAGTWNHKIHAHMGTNNPFETWRKADLGRRQRAAQATLIGDPDADPIIPTYSGTLAHVSENVPASVTLWPGMTHHQTAIHQDLCKTVLEQVIDMASLRETEDARGDSQLVELPSFQGLFGAGSD